ncbi:methionine/alanine import family NSS transporter small subunit [Actinotalea sp. M2MS4P-6]|nr:methionine/alanine import family NSS transporter small subunit [Actinotalea sp. M2MS4P-6]MCV2393038.1 methionine/alanine import family NSS transporter small subunit [Actinotalea sp. M2MS4P-6]
MTATAVTFLVLSASVIWGGLITAILVLRRDTRRAGPDPDDED